MSKQSIELKMSGSLFDAQEIELLSLLTKGVFTLFIAVLHPFQQGRLCSRIFHDTVCR